MYECASCTSINSCVTCSDSSITHREIYLPGDGTKRCICQTGFYDTGNYEVVCS